MSELVNLYDAKTHLSQLVDRAARGEEIVIGKNGVALAKLGPLAATHEPRKPAGALGIERIGDDFDEPLPAEIEAAFAGRT